MVTDNLVHAYVEKEQRMSHARLNEEEGLRMSKEDGVDKGNKEIEGKEKEERESNIAELKSGHRSGKQRVSNFSKQMSGNTRSRSMREVMAVQGSGTGYLKQLAANLPSDLAQLEEYIPDFIKTYASSSLSSQKPETVQQDTILCTTFQQVQIYHRDSSGSNRIGKESYTLCIGYSDGFQVWDVSEELAAKEITSVRNFGPVWICKFLKDPGCTNPCTHANGSDSASADQKDRKEFAKKLKAARPLIAVVNTEGEDSSGVAAPNVVRLYSLRSHKSVHRFTMESKVLKVESNEHIVAVGLHKKIYGYSARTLEQKFSVDCFPSPISSACTFALGERWIAFPGTRNVVGTSYDLNLAATIEAGPTGESSRPSKATKVVDDEHIWTKSVTNAAKDIAAGIYYLGDLGLKKIEAQRKGSTSKEKETPGSASSMVNGKSSGREQKKERQKEGMGSIVIQDFTNDLVVANFQSHHSAILHLEFDPSGSLLVSSSLEGQIIKVHKILPRNPNDLSTGVSSATTTPSHRLLYKLNRGFTQAAIRHVSFSNDLRWLAVTSARGTTHIFPISPCGGPVNSLTHPVQTMPSGSSSFSLSSSPLSSSRSDDGWGIRDKIMSLSSSLTKGSPPIPSSSSNLSTSLGSTSSFSSYMEKNSGSNSSAKAKTARPVATFAPYPMPSSGHGGTKEGVVLMNALARVRQRIQAHFPGSATQRSNNPGGLDDVEANHEEDPRHQLARLLANIPVPVCSLFRGATLTLMSSGGLMDQYELIPTAGERDQRELQLHTVPSKCWDICRRHGWAECKPQVGTTSLYPPLPCATAGTVSNRRSSQDGEYNDDDDKRRAEWLSHVEIHSHTQPLTHVWAAPQFRFATFNDSEDDSYEIPAISSLLIETVPSTPVVVRGAGPMPTFNKLQGSERAHDGQMEGEDDVGVDSQLDDLRNAIETPARFEDLYITDDQEIDQHVLVFDDDMNDEANTYQRDSPNLFEDDGDDLEEDFDGFVLPSPGTWEKGSKQE